MQNLGWISELQDPSKILVVSVISRISPRSPLYQWSWKSVQDLRWTSDLEDPSKIFVVSVVAEICLRSWVVEEWAYQTGGGGLKTLCIKIGHSEPSRLKDRSQTLVVSVNTEIRPRSWFYRWSQRSVQDLRQIIDRGNPFKIFVGPVISKITPRL